jgi:hypothetical protein
MTFIYDQTDNVFDGRTVHYRVKALTGADSPLYVTISVLDSNNNCNLKTLNLVAADPLAYPTLVYKAETTTGATQTSLYTNDNDSLCPVTEDVILTSDALTPINTLQGLIFYKNAGGTYMIDSTYYNGDDIELNIKLNTAWDEPIYKVVQITRLTTFL